MASRSFVQWRAPPGRQEPRPLHGVWVDGGRDGSQGEWWVMSGQRRASPLDHRVAACFASRMITGAITGLWVFVGSMIGTILVARRVRRTAARAEAGEAVFFPVGANLPDEGRRRYSLGQVPAGSGFQWKPRRSWTRLRELPTDLRYVCAREATFRERLWLPSD